MTSHVVVMVVGVQDIFMKMEHTDIVFLVWVAVNAGERSLLAVEFLSNALRWCCGSLITDIAPVQTAVAQRRSFFSKWPG